VSALFDTSLLLDYLNGVPQAEAACGKYAHRAITIVTWAEIMTAAPLKLRGQTREFLRSFERLAINEAIADRAIELTQTYKGLALRHAMPWATAQANKLLYVTVDSPPPSVRDDSLLVPYRLRHSRL
jgi:predicted nucleic acid-binding protein